MLEDIDLAELTEINGDLEASRSVLIDLHIDELVIKNPMQSPAYSLCLFRDKYLQWKGLQCFTIVSVD